MREGWGWVKRSRPFGIDQTQLASLLAGSLSVQGGDPLQHFGIGEVAVTDVEVVVTSHGFSRQAHLAVVWEPLAHHPPGETPHHLMGKLSLPCLALR